MTKKKDFFKLSNVNRETWGIIHYLGFLGKKEEVRKLFHLLSRFFVCPKCRRHITEFLILNPTPASFDDTIDFHNAVNQRIGKPIFKGKDDLIRIFESGKEGESFLLKKDYTFKDGLTGIYYILLLTFYHVRNLYRVIKEDVLKGTFIHSFLTADKESSFKSLFLAICETVCDEEIFFVENYKNIEIEISTEDFKPYFCV